MTQIFALMLSLALMFSLAACGGTDGNNNTSSSNDKKTESVDSKESADSDESADSGEEVAETQNTPSWLDGSWSYIDSKQAYKITVIDEKTLLWEAVYYTENNGFEMEGSKTGVDYSVEREYVYDPEDGSVIISAYDATGATAAVNGDDVGYLVKVRVTLAPDKDRDGRTAAMFTLYSEDESSDYEYNKLRYQRTDG